MLGLLADEAADPPVVGAVSRRSVGGPLRAKPPAESGRVWVELEV